MRKVETYFESCGDQIASHLYYPDDFESNTQLPAIVVAGPMATVKEQAAGVFAQALANRGFIALAFDYRRFGESEGSPRQFENPASKTEDVQTAVSFLCAHNDVKSDQIGAAGICASSSYIAPAVSTDRRIKAFGTVSAHFSLREFFVENPMVTDEVLQQMLSVSNAARQTYFETGVSEPDSMIWPDFTGEEEDALDPDIYDYYFARRAECWPNFSNHLVPFSLEQLIRSHALDYADQIVAPYLGVVGSEAVTRSYTERFVDAKSRGPKSIKVIEGARHIQAYDVPEYIDQGTDALAEFFGEYLTA
jgi:fermentation-respiration switch protein FrsA (DUF1100 family)